MNDEAISTAWTMVALTQDVAQVALDAVRYRRNYARSVNSRLCLHYINSIRERVDTDSIVSYLFSVDGCMSSEIVPTGRCDIYYCRPYTYELQVTQKAVGSDVFLVQSIYKTLSQKSLAELRGDSNLDFTTEATGVAESVQAPEEASATTYNVTPTAEPSKTSGANNAVDWADGLQDAFTSKPLALQIQHISLAESPSEQLSAAPGPKSVAIIGIVAVAVAMVGFVLAIVVGRWRARRAARRSQSQQYPPLRGTLMTSDNSNSMASRDSIAANITPREKVDLLG